jgi:hypothetical protein
MNATDSLQRETCFQIIVNDVICENLLIWGFCHQMVLEVCMNVWLKLVSSAKIYQMDPAKCLQRVVQNEYQC